MSTQIQSIKQQLHLHYGKRILLIEDNAANRMLLSDYLSYCKYDVQSLSEASNFFCTLEVFKPELIILDLKLPDIDGYTLLEQMQQQSHLCNVPTIVVSAFAFKADQERALRLGARRYFVKPINLQEFILAIEEELACLCR
ncbi:MAG: response regulator [Scytonema sp. PMC 1069.18]|nr:response regulator [Scytonema sp. PMC 1069.18]MEC4886760.1 response regulator [Scytonema sp. PMC 1070.18]